MTDMDRGKDYEPDIYATHEEDYDDFDVEEEEEGGSRAAIILLVVIGVVLLLGVAFVSYRMGFENGQRQASVPRLQAAAQGGKVKPDDPGGLAPPQESALDESITGDGGEELNALLPSEEQGTQRSDGAADGEPVVGIDVPITLEGADPDSESVEPEDAPDSVPVEAAEPESSPPPKPSQTETEQAQADSSSSSTSGRILVPKPGASVPSPSTSSPGASSSGSDAVPSPPASSVPSPSAASGPAPSGPAPNAGMSGDYVVQLASLPSQAAANTAWQNLSSKYSDLLDGAVRDIEEADLGEKGIFYRLRVGYFEGRSEANRLCDMLKSRGQDCLVKNR